LLQYRTRNGGIHRLASSSALLSAVKIYVAAADDASVPYVDMGLAASCTDEPVAMMIGPANRVLQTSAQLACGAIRVGQCEY
jgi:hypothetical protein